MRVPPEAVPSHAHIFPYVMGGSGATDETVCKGCNGLINRRVETPALPSFLPFQSLFGIRGRRNDIRRVPGTITVDGETGHVSLNDRGEITAAVVIPIKSADGKPNYLLFGPKDLVEAKMRTLTARNPALKWEESGPEADRAQVFVEVDPHRSRLHLRRLAAKVAFERWAQLRSAEFVSDPDYDVIRKFILDGEENEICCGVLSDRRLLDGAFRVFPPPRHTAYIIAHPADHILGAVVSFYSLFYYWAILSRQYVALGPTDNLLEEDPQAREASTPLLRARVGSVRMPWDEIVHSYRRDPVASEKAALRHAMQKFQVAADTFYGREEHCEE